MAIVKRVRKLVNPRTRKAKGKHKRKGNPKHRRRTLSPAQKAAGFGGKRAKAAVRARRPRHAKRSIKRTRAKSNPSRTRTRTRVVTKTKWRTRKVYVKAKAHRKRSRRSNPAGLLVTYGPAMLNPKRRKSVAKRKAKRKNPRARTRVITKIRYRTRGRKNPHRSRKGHRRGHRNPGGFGSMKDMGTAVVGGLVGVTITKTVPAMLPATMLSSGLMRIAVSAAVAWGAGMLGSKFVGGEFGKYVLFGGLMQAGSVALNTFIPSIGSAIGLQGLTPSNDILLPYNMFQGRGAMIGSPGTMSRGSGSGFAPAFA